MDLILYADATPDVGAGHAMRLLVLAEAWLRRGLGRVSLHGEISLGFVERRLAALGVDRPSGPPGAAGVLVVDSYDPGERARHALSSAGLLRVLVDDLGEPVPEGYHVLWNPNAYGTSALYRGFRGELVTGAEAVPIRHGLPRWTGSVAAATGVMLGGGSPPSLLVEAMRLLAERLGEPNLHAAGAWVPDGWRRVDASDPWSDLASCGRLITAAGSTVWEAAAVGIPTVVVRTVPNQDLVSRWAAHHGAPVVDAADHDDPAALALAIAERLTGAVSLPPLVSGAERVARRLLDTLSLVAHER